MHARISGTVDFREPDDDSCIARIRALVDKIGAPNASSVQQPCEIARSALFRRRHLRHIFKCDPGKQYDMRESWRASSIASEFEEYRAEYGQTLTLRLQPASAAGPVGHRRPPIRKNTCRTLAPARIKADRVWRRNPLIH